MSQPCLDWRSSPLTERDNTAAQSWLDKAAEADPKDLRPRIAKVELLLAAGQTEHAISAARELESQRSQ